MEEQQLVLICGTLLIGGVLLAFLAYYFSSNKNRHVKGKSDNTNKNVTDTDEKKQNEQREVSGSTTGVSSGSSKRQAKSKKRREAQQEFTHSWMVGALKGHTAPVLDMDFSANGKFLASCAEDCGLVPTKEEMDSNATNPTNVSTITASNTSKESTRTSSASCSTSGESTNIISTSNAANAPPSPSSSTSSSSGSSVKQEHRAILSRRQRKNRTRAPRRELRERDEDHEDDHNGPPPPSLQPSAPPRLRGQHHRDHETKTKSTNVRNGQNASNENKSVKPVKDQKKNSNNESSKNNNTENKKNKNLTSTPHTITKPRQLHHLTDAALASLLRRYTLTGDQLAHLGYPVEFSHFPGFVIIINYQQHPLSLRAHHRLHHYMSYNQQHNLDVNAREFVPSSWNNNNIEGAEVDSGTGSAGSSLESSDLEQESSSDSDKSSDNGDSSGSPSPSSQQCHNKQEKRIPASVLQNAIERRCARCFRPFYVNRENGEYFSEEKCCYHWGKLRNGIDGSPSGESWECCRGRETSRGCTTARAHVWTGIVPGYNGPFPDYARTRPARHMPRDGNYGVYALDCEMCFTKRGLELGKVTVVALDGKVVYEAMVKPDAEIIDYNTRFSGLRPKDLARASKSLRDVQKDITSFVHAETILIGHGLENDLRALRILHPTVIDTCVAFPHFLGYPFRSSLKTLARTVLRKEIQIKEHDSAEDARIAVDLMLKRLQHDFF